ncbi:VOC family protein [Rhodopseudomonas pseudopalustris]|uniref:VOC family protein n=1 Tax=Rhodopseudomonas pseudopalustris TaxID=1513892 RepID=UPI003F9B4A26
MAKINGILESAIYVDDLERARAFYGELIGLRSMHDDRRMSAYDAGNHSAFLVFARGGSTTPARLPGGLIPPHDGHGPLHVAFAIPDDQLPVWEQRLAAHQIAIEGRVRWPRGGESIYFRDPEGHLVELATPGLWDNYLKDAPMAADDDDRKRAEQERRRIQNKQGGHHWPPRADDGPPLDDTDRNTDKVIKPSRRKP